MKNIRSDAPRERLIFALDVGEGLTEVLSWVKRLRDHVGCFKVGKEAFTHLGPGLVEAIHQGGGRVFLDLKFHDIPNTVARAAEAAVRMGVNMFNVHALGGSRMMVETATAVRNMAARLDVPAPVILAVTVLTSLDDRDLSDLGFRMSTEALVVHLAVQARAAGLDGVVASARDVPAIRAACGEACLIVTPGIRRDGVDAGDDQKRILSPEGAVAAGADYLVVGRPIRMAVDPAAEADDIVRAITAGLATRTGAPPRV
ncbi:MAG: orotidine-5'-phosphate decarboxylase [Syntrophales bacterium]|jgi:orotidine-5'-phosphate decarboxylase|nr:orotidine-5'-phosphate decarboxylase [Syntrophales bacterium]MDD4338621.1 orotidine-5'-phosphate decarboxylase [Syntrophales bacterium]HOG07709.1 orotidine-5'-phosphate decarboxylase [Syntrophales bacterium]HOS78169.1 orotidine-5'-phosphate decarboxylase [Syntrophales bacterium]HPB71013.1 orotidine-5'-phosphate decarboxylase [Syntrophales bacterium]